ncbi:MAG: hypothetical protein R2706_16820 [Acidimicrobiales bacterium]
MFNNLWWVFAVTVFATGMGLRWWRGLTDGAKENRREPYLQVPMAVNSLNIIWRFMYRSQNVKKNQTGVLSAIWAWLGSKKKAAAPRQPPAPHQNFDIGSGPAISASIVNDFRDLQLPAKNLFGLVFLMAAFFTSTQRSRPIQFIEAGVMTTCWLQRYRLSRLPNLHRGHWRLRDPRER